MGKLDGKIALVTGGSEGIGFATAQQFIAEGAYVFITGRRKEALDTAVGQLGGDSTTGIQADSTKLNDLENVINVIQKAKGKLDVLFVNAGFGGYAPIESMTEKFFDDQFNINVKGLLFTVQKALRIFTNGGSVILCGSAWSIKGVAGASAYCATKAAVRSFARSWAVELKDRKIRVNCLSPGPTSTPAVTNAASEEQINTVVATTLVGRICQPAEIAKAALFLASEDSSYTTGIELFVDGGLAQI